MEAHLTLNDTEFEQLFETAILDPKLFSHEAHLRLAWIHIKNYGKARAVKNLTCQIKAFAKKHGLPDKFNMTVTVAAINAVHHFFQKSTSTNFVGFIEEFPRLKFHFKDLMDAHYGFDIYGSKKAKQTFLKPDLLPFD